MAIPLRVLIVEDSENDTLLLARELRSGGYEPTYERVETLEAIKVALDKHWDLVLSDYTMPGFDGLSALKIARETCPDVPFIFVSGTLGEDIAIEALKYGAVDYVFKDRLSRLVTCVRRALREVEEQRELKRAQETLRESEARKKAMLEGALDCIIAIDHQGKILEFNLAAERTFGYTLDQVIGKPLVDLIIPPHLRDKHKQGLKQHIATGEGPFIGKVVEVTAMRADGTEFPTELAITSIGQKWPPMFLGHIRDITERKRAEEKMRLQSAALESAANSVVITDRDGIITWVNPAFTRLTGYSQQEMIGQTPRLLKSGTQDQPFYENLWNTILSGQVWSGEIVNRRKDGVLYTEEQTITPVRNNQGEVTHFIAIKQNITERKLAEKDRDRLVSIIEGTTDLVGIADPAGRLFYLNKNGRKMLGISEDEDISGFQVSDSHPEPAKKLVFEEAIPTAIREGVWSGENTLLIRDGRQIPVSQVVLAHRAPDGSVEFLSTIIRDITERKRAEEEIQRNLERIRALHEIDLAITSTLDLHGILHVLLEKIDLVLPYAATTVRLFNPENGLLEPAACRNLDEKEWKTEAWRGGRGLANVAFETNAPTIIRNAQTDPRVRDPEFYRKHKLISYLAIPLIAKEKTLGVIGFYTKQEHDFSNDEVEFLKTLAGQAAIAIHNARLYQEATVREKKILVAHEQLDALNTITAIASQSLDLKTVTQSVIQKITEIFDFDATRIHLYNARRDELLLSAHFSKEPERFRAVGSFPRGQGIAGRVAESGEPLIFEDLTMEPLYESMSRSGNSETKGRRFFAALPIKSGRLVLGTLVCIGFAPRRLSVEEVQLLTSMAGQIAVAVENAHLFEETYHRADELTRKTFELEKSNRAKDEFLAMISHELRTPLNVMMGYTGLLREGMFGALNPQQDDALKKVVIQSNDLLSIVSNLLRATQIGSGEIKAQRARTDLGPLLDDLKNGYDLPLNNGLTLNWDFPSDLPTVDTDSEKLRHILVNLIHNAIKFTEKGSVTIAARHLPISKTLRFTVADTGPGIAKKSLPLIFDMFHQVDSSNTRAYGGLGLGLYIVKKYTEMLGGEIKVKSTPGRGSVFRVALPYESMPSGQFTLPAVTPQSRIADPWIMER
jgi:PAS domain S-box-containing protein